MVSPGRSPERSCPLEAESLGGFFIAHAKTPTKNEAYAVCSSAVDYRVTQVVDGNKGVHAMIPKDIFK